MDGASIGVGIAASIGWASDQPSLLILSASREDRHGLIAVAHNRKRDRLRRRVRVARSLSFGALAMLRVIKV